MKNKQDNSLRTLAIQMTLRFTLISLFAALLTFAAKAQIQQRPTGDPSWVPTGNLGTERASHTATLLPNGKVLVAGGVDSSLIVVEQCGAVRSSHWDLDGDRHHGHRTSRSHGDAAAQWQGAGGGRSR